MNEQLESFARDSIKHNLAAMPEANQMFFKRMYSHDNPDADINDVVDNMPSDKLDWAMRQIENTVINAK